MDAKKALPLIVAVVMAAGAGWVALKMIHKSSPQALATKMPQVVVASHDIEAGTVLTADDLTLGTIGVAQIPPMAFQNVADCVGRVPKLSMISGWPLTAAMLAPKGSVGGLEATLPIGMRAMTLEINEFSGVAGYIGPGCHVDVLQTMRDAKTGDSLVRTLTQNVKILAVGLKANPNANGQPDTGGARSVTVLVTPAQSELLELASATGRERLTLRSTNDIATPDLPVVTMAELQGRPNTPAQAAPPTTQPSVAQEDPNSWTVRIVRAGQESDSKFKLNNNPGQAVDDPGQFKPLVP